MFILPVIDLSNGQVVRGVAGRRSEYRPIVSRLTTSALPLEVAEAFRGHFGFDELYLADLDAIAGSAPACSRYAELIGRGFRLWVDAGVRDHERALELAAAGVEQVIVGLETVRGPDELSAICQRLGAERLVFSLDLKGGRPLGNAAAWQAADARAIARQTSAAGVRQLIVLDLERVGVKGGTGTQDLCGRLADEFPDLTLIAGGGIRNQEDIDRLEKCGVRGVLVASALHDGTLRPGKPDQRALTSRER